MSGYPKRELLWLRGWVNPVLVELPGMLVREAEEDRFRSDPHSPVKWPPKESTKKRKSLKRCLEDVIEDLRKHGGWALADEVKRVRSLERKAFLLKKFYNEQVAIFGEPEDRPTPRIAPPDTLQCF